MSIMNNLLMMLVNDILILNLMYKHTYLLEQAFRPLNLITPSTNVTDSITKTIRNRRQANSTNKYQYPIDVYAQTGDVLNIIDNNKYIQNQQNSNFITKEVSRVEINHSKATRKQNKNVEGHENISKNILRN